MKPPSFSGLKWSNEAEFHSRKRMPDRSIGWVVESEKSSDIAGNSTASTVPDAAVEHLTRDRIIAKYDELISCSAEIDGQESQSMQLNR
jgi:hypothetical protein